MNTSWIHLHVNSEDGITAMLHQLTMMAAGME